MITKDSINISSIETYLYGIISKNVSENTYVGILPDTTQSKWTDMCLIDTDTQVSDYNAFGSGIVYVWLYAKPMKSGAKNVKKMSELEKRLNEVVRNASDERYFISRRNTYSDYDNKRKWHCNIVELNITIV